MLVVVLVVAIGVVIGVGIGVMMTSGMLVGVVGCDVPVPVIGVYLTINTNWAKFPLLPTRFK